MKTFDSILEQQDTKDCWFAIAYGLVGGAEGKVVIRSMAIGTGVEISQFENEYESGAVIKFPLFMTMPTDDEEI